MTEKYLGVHVELGDDAKYVVKAERTIKFQLKLRRMLEAKDMLFEARLKRNLLLVLVMEDRGYEVMIRNGQALIRLEDTIAQTQH